MAEVSAFTGMARAEFMNGMIEAGNKPMPANHELFTTTLPSAARIETHAYWSSLPRLSRFKGYSPGVRLSTKTYAVENFEYRAGPVNVSKSDINDDQLGGYLKQIGNLPERARKDIGHIILAHLAAGTSGLCFDGTAMFANSHVFGSGDNLDTFDPAASDASVSKIIALVTDNGAMKPVIFQDREPLNGLQTDADTPQAEKLREFEYWSDCRFGLGYGAWWDAIHLTISDTPTVPECYTIVKQLIDNFRTFTLPKGKDSDDVLKVHEGWEPSADNFILLCSMKLAETLSTAITITQYVTGSGLVDNVYRNKAKVIPTSALD